jgi:2,4-dienoyl-CoA reductase-like NADH-dependent reductase (Old Yellow Enzyme family)
MLTSTTDALFRPFSIKSLNLRNRIVMAPMTRFFAPDGVPNQDNAAYYGRRAAGGAGLILSEGTVIGRPASRNHSGIPFFHGTAALNGWKDVIDVVHAAGGRMGPQIWHVGAAELVDPAWKLEGAPDSPSGLLAPGKSLGQPMTDEAIADTVSAFAQAAADAKRLGFDVVEIHGAHGYLIDQFFWSGTNNRQDRFGGPSIRQRARFAGEVISAVRRAVGPDFPILFRVSQWKTQDFTARIATSPSEMADWLQPLVDAGVDILHCSQRRFWEPEFPEIDGERGLNFAGWAKKLTGAATISVGSVGLSGEFTRAFSGEGAKATGIDQLIERMEKEEFDLVAVGRALLNDPNWIHKIRSGDLDSVKDFDATALSTLA